MSVTDHDCAALLMAIYGFSPDPKWDHYDAGDGDAVCYGVKVIDKQPVIVLRGSTTLQDWIRDFDCVADPFASGGLGPVHPGFLAGMENVLQETLVWGGSPVICGHSLGAGRACVLAGYYMLSGNIPMRRVCFGEPKPGFAPLGQLIAPIPAASYCAGDFNGHDLVTDVPFSFPPEEYAHPAPLKHLEVTPLADDPWGMFRYHHMQLYYGALAYGA